MKKILLALGAAFAALSIYALGFHRGARTAMADGSAVNALTMAQLAERKNSEGAEPTKSEIFELRRQLSLYDTASSLNSQTAEYLIPEFALKAISFRLREIQRQQAISYARMVERSLSEGSTK